MTLLLCTFKIWSLVAIISTLNRRAFISCLHFVVFRPKRPKDISLDFTD